MSKRLQVLFEEDELTELQEIARQNHMTLAEWVRQTLREARSQQPTRTAALKRQAVRRAIEHEFPVADIDEMITQIERGYEPSSG
ncbi:MAG: antitoxin [Acidobacteria bacterium]|nr:MAG: antitoxin [Acidobacteriota bacterium]